MPDIPQMVALMRVNPAGLRYSDLCKVCDFYFGAPRMSSGSHRVYKTHWSGDRRVNIQNSHGKAKAYQVRQVLKAIERLEVERGTDKLQIHLPHHLVGRGWGIRRALRGIRKPQLAF